MALEKQEYVRAIPPKENLSDWYTAVVLKAELADYAPVRGCMVIRPYGYAIWELMQQELDRRFKETGHKNAYFPLFIPESLLQKEAEHVAGFAPQVAWVTQGGQETLTERLAVRPTSEALICTMYAKWIQSYRDLPVLLLQWNNVVRWERSTRLFLRTMEFLWHEGHTVHRTAEEADEEARLILRIYQEFIEGWLAIPVLVGKKTDSEKFAGADYTYTLEVLMPDGQALQAGTSHFLGQNFSKAFGIKFLDRDNQEKHPWQTSWAVTTRLIGALIMIHGDDRGLVLPPKVAPYQVVIVPIFYEDQQNVLEKARELAGRLAGRFRVHLDDRLEYTPGWKFNDWEMRGVPLRLEVGPRDVAKGQVVLVPRVGGGKVAVPEAEVEAQVERTLEDVQGELFKRAKAFLDSRIFPASTVEDVEEIMTVRKGFARVLWCGRMECEDTLRERTGASPRVIPLDETESGSCVVCGQPAGILVYYARAY